MTTASTPSAQTTAPWMCIKRNSDEERIEGADESGDALDCLYNAALECVAQKTKRLYFVRGPMGSGLSTLMRKLHDKIHAVGPIVGGNEGVTTYNGTPIDRARLRSGTVLLDAGTIRDASNCEQRISRLEDDGKCVFVFGAEDFLRATNKRPFGFFDLEPIRRGEGDCARWIWAVGKERGLDADKTNSLQQLYERVAIKTEFQWVGWMSLLADLINKDAAETTASPLEIFYRATESRFSETISRIKKSLLEGRLDMSEMVSNPANPARDCDYKPLHLEIVRAMLVLEDDGREDCRFKMLLAANLPFDAIGLLNAHLDRASTLGDKEFRLIDRYCEFLKGDPFPSEDKPQAGGHILHAQGLVAECLLRTQTAQRLEKHVREKARSATDDFKTRIEQYIEDGLGGLSRTMSVAQLWDLSDTLHKIGSRRVEEAIADHSKNSYFCEFGGDGRTFSIGSGTLENARLADVLAREKPLRPYRKTAVQLPKVWIAKYLVTVGEYREFHEDCKANEGKAGEKFFAGPGFRWYRRDAEFLRQIEADFDRTMWRSLACEESVRDTDRGKGVGNYETRIRRRAVNGREGDATRWKRIWQSESHHKLNRLPVVDVNWWEAEAYCRWFTQCKLHAAGFDRERYEARLIPDWMWEAVLAQCLGKDHDPDAPITLSEPQWFDGHVRRNSNREPGRVGHYCFPVHVGLFSPPECKTGPYDMSGNVWEWTASASFAEMQSPSWWDSLRRLLGSSSSGTRDYGEGTSRTIWVDPSKEREPMHQGRHADGPPLQMRVLRGGSFMSRPQYAWGSCMRTCDPPYYSFQDAGFRIAVFERGLAP